MSAGDPMRIVEAAYRWEPDDATWLRGIVEAAASIYPQTFAYVVDHRDALLRPNALVHTASARDMVAHFLEFASMTPDGLARVAHIPSGRLVGSSDTRALRTLLGDELESYLRLARVLNVPPVHVLAGGDATADVLCIGWASGKQLAPHRRALGYVSSHLGTAIRLRMSQPRAPAANDVETEAVLDARGRVLDARGEAGEKRARASLTGAVLASEAARSKRRATAEERLAMWTALVAAQWAIVETTERDGKRLLLARRNAPIAFPLPGLEPRERVVATLAATGHAMKEMAYELGLSVSTVSTTLRSAMTKLNVSSRAELVRWFGVLATKSRARVEEK